MNYFLLIGCMSKDMQNDSAASSSLEDQVILEPTEEPEDSGLEPEEETEEEEPEEEPCEPVTYEPNPFVHSVLDYEPGEGAGFGQDQYPDIIFGPPLGGGENAGSLDVLSLGEGGHISFSFQDLLITDEEGPDIIIFENPFVGWTEAGIAAASMDGEEWIEWPCDLETLEGCVGTNPVLTHPDNCIDARDAELAGGDPLDLATIGLSEARYIRIRDAAISGPGGFDLDAAVVIHGQYE
jgi:hypothetical protein